MTKIPDKHQDPERPYFSDDRARREQAKIEAAERQRREQEERLAKKQTKEEGEQLQLPLGSAQPAEDESGLYEVHMPPGAIAVAPSAVVSGESDNPQGDAANAADGQTVDLQDPGQTPTVPVQEAPSPFGQSSTDEVPSPGEPALVSGVESEPSSAPEETPGEPLEDEEGSHDGDHQFGFAQG